MFFFRAFFFATSSEFGEYFGAGTEKMRGDFGTGVKLMLPTKNTWIETQSKKQKNALQRM